MYANLHAGSQRNMTKNLEVSFTLEDSLGSVTNTTAHHTVFAYLMTCTGIHRITSREDVYELFKRACLLFPNLHFSKGYHKKEDLFYFSVDGEAFTFELGELRNCIGASLSEVKVDKLNFFDWLDGFKPKEKVDSKLEFEKSSSPVCEQHQNCFLNDISGNPLKTELQSNLQWPLSETNQRNAEFYAQQLLPYMD